MNNKLTKYEIGRLAGIIDGIIDGEGCIYFGRYKTNSRYKTIGISISNTDIKIIKKVSEILDKMKINYHWSTVKREMNVKWKKAFRLHITDWRSIKKLLIFILPFLVGKQEKAGKMYILADKRKELTRRGYSNEEKALFNDKANVLFVGLNKENWLKIKEIADFCKNNQLDINEVIKIEAKYDKGTFGQKESA